MEGRAKWAESLEPRILEMRQKLQLQDPAAVAQASGALYEREPLPGRLNLSFFGRPYVVGWPELVVCDTEGRISHNAIQSVLLEYLVLADGTPLQVAWVSLRELPNGAFYEAAFQSYSGNLLVRTFKSELESFYEAAKRAGGEPISLGDRAFRFWVLPRLPLAVVYWSGGGEFPDSAQVLFDASASSYQPLEVLAHLGGMVCEKIIKSKVT
jgi:hypothetical protein